MSSARSTKTPTPAQVEETAVENGFSTLVKQGFVLEVTAREADTKDVQGNIIKKGSVMDFYHHPCMRDKCTHEDKSSAGQWKKVPAANPERCVN